MYKIPESQNIMIHLRNWTISHINHSDELNEITLVKFLIIKFTNFIKKN